jgi:hypothetical protein
MDGDGDRQGRRQTRTQTRTLTGRRTGTRVDTGDGAQTYRRRKNVQKHVKTFKSFCALKKYLADAKTF